MDLPNRSDQPETDPDATDKLPQRPRILLVEDQWLIAMDLATQLSEGGFEVVGPASSLARALELIGSERLDGALLDINLDGEMSYPAATALMQKSISFAFLSGHSSDDLEPEFADCRLLNKPISPAELIAEAGSLVHPLR